MRALALGVTVVLMAGAAARADGPQTYRDDQLVPYGKYTRSRPGGPTRYYINSSYLKSFKKAGDKTQERLDAIEKKLDHIIRDLESMEGSRKPGL